MKSLIFQGTATAMVTPFGEKGLDYEAFGRQIDRQIEAGISALVICGTTGEAPTLEDDEHLEAIAFAVQHAKRRAAIIAGTGSNNTEHAVMMSREAKNRGADALLWVTPYYNKTTQRGLYQHYKTLAGATDLPAILYNVPSRTGVDIKPETVEALSAIDTIVAIKEASGSVARAVDILNRCGDGFSVYSGNDDIIVPLMSVGAKGVISVLSNVAPKETENICQLCFNGRFAEAGALQVRYFGLISALFSEVNPIPVKTAMRLMGLDSGRVRLPLYEMEGKNEARLKEEMNKLHLL